MIRGALTAVSVGFVIWCLYAVIWCCFAVRKGKYHKSKKSGKKSR